MPEDSTRVPSDHNPWLATPAKEPSTFMERQVICKSVRPFTCDSRNRLGNWLQSESWEYVYDGHDSSEMASRFHSMLSSQIDLLSPAPLAMVNLFSLVFKSWPEERNASMSKKEIVRNIGT